MNLLIEEEAKNLRVVFDLKRLFWLKMGKGEIWVF